MRRWYTAAITVTILLTASWALASGDGSGSAPAAGVIHLDPPQPLTCVAVRVEVPDDQMVAGVRWYNGAATAFPRVFVASGTQVAPPPLDEAVTLADSVPGQEQQWSTATFAAPVASESGTLFIVFEYPAQAPEAGIGYAPENGQYPYFVSGDGRMWVRVDRGWQVLLEPILVDRVRGVAMLRADRLEEAVVPEVVKVGLTTAPNPFNPQTKIELLLSEVASGTLRVYDVRGRLVAELHRGMFAQGANSFVWSGRDGSGRAVASGAYWVQANTDDQTFTRKVLLLK